MKLRNIPPQTAENIVKTLLAVMFIIFTNAGFNGYLDIEQRFFVLAMGIDKGTDEEPYEVTLKISVPQPSLNANENEFILLTKRSRTIASAVAYLKAKAGKEFDFGHMRIIFIGDELAEDPWLTTLDWFFRRRDVQNVAYVAVARPTAKEVLNLRPSYERIPANAFLLSFGTEGTESPYVVSTYLINLHRKFFERGIDAVVSIVNALGENHFEIRNSYVVSKSGAKMEMSSLETGLYNIFLMRSERATLSIDDNQGKPFAITADEIHLDYHFDMNSNRPSVTITGDFYAQMEESFERVEPGQLPEFERRMEKHINEEMVKLLEKLQRNGVDPFGFGLRYRAMHMDEKGEWETWKEIYPKMKFASKVHVRLNSTGTIK